MELYLKQTPPLINIIIQSLHDKNWDALQAAAHKIIPSFVIVGLSADFSLIAKKIQQYATVPHLQHQIPDLVLQLQKVCIQACKEMEAALITIKNTSYE